MKKTFKYLFCLLLTSIAFIPLLNAKAASALVDIYASNKNPIVGSSITVTVYVKSDTALGGYQYELVYDTSKLKLTNGEIANAEYISNDTTKSMSKAFTFKVIAEGASTVSAKNIIVPDFQENYMTASVSGVTVTGKIVVNKPVTYSTNNYLTNLAISNYTLSPVFNKNALEYKVTLAADVEEITINATKEDSSATISGTGTLPVTEGDNKFEIIVTSEKGTKRVYTILATVIDENPINIVIDNKAYTIIKRSSLLEKPNTYEETIVNINNLEIPAFKSEITKYTLVGVKNTEGKIYLAIYDEDNNFYSIYQELKFNNLTLNILNETTTIPNNYKVASVKIGDAIVKGYKYNNKSNYALIYALNIETGIKNLYLYEETENTVQIYNSGETNALLEKNKAANMLIYCFVGATIILSVLLIVVATTKGKKQKEDIKDIKKDKPKKSEKDLEITKEIKKLDDIKKEKTTIIDLTKDKEIESEKVKDTKKKKKSHDIFEDW